MVEILNLIILILFTGGLLATTFAISRRLLDYRHLGLRPPLLAKRDISLFISLAWPFLLILIFRVLGLSPQVYGTVLWTLITGIPPVVGVLVFAYMEFFVIERKDSRGYLSYLSQAIEEKEARLIKEIEERNESGSA